MKALTWHGKRDVRLPLEQGPLVYEKFQKKQDGFVKVLLKP